MESTFNDIINILKSGLSYDDKLRWCESIFAVLEEWYKNDERESCLAVKRQLIPILTTIIEECSNDYMPSFFEYYRKSYAFAARRDFECFVDYMEWRQPKKIYGKRRDVLKPYVDALDELVFNPTLQYVIASYAPSMGKSYLATLWSAWAFGLSTENTIIRLSYSEELVLGCSRNVKAYLRSQSFAEIFTNFALFESKPFEVEKESDWKIKNANVPKSNHIARTRNGATTGERATFGIILDDMTKGAEEANTDKVHKDIYNKWNTEWWNRRDGDNCKFLFVGTQWCPEDILNKIIQDRDKIERLQPTENKYVVRNSSTIVIRVPMLDENGITTCPAVYPQETANQIKENTDEFLFSCVYQQQPIAPTGRVFAWELLRQYDYLPELGSSSYAVLDPARRGKDNVSMPIHSSLDSKNYYLIDAIFRQEPMDQLYDLIVDKIIENHVILLVLENNIDTSLKYILDEKLKRRKYYICEIREKFNTVKKEKRIKDYRGVVQKDVIFPSKNLLKGNTDLSRFMDNMTRYSFDYPNEHDDAPDSECMFASEIILRNGFFGKVKPIRRPF